jgi:hypothetical protein
MTSRGQEGGRKRCAVSSGFVHETPAHVRQRRDRKRISAYAL